MATLERCFKTFREPEGGMKRTFYTKVPVLTIKDNSIIFNLSSWCIVSFLALGYASFPGIVSNLMPVFFSD